MTQINDELDKALEKELGDSVLQESKTVEIPPFSVTSFEKTDNLQNMLQGNLPLIADQVPCKEHTCKEENKRNIPILIGLMYFLVILNFLQTIVLLIISSKLTK